MKNLLVVSALIELGAGIMLVCLPSTAVVLLTGAPLETTAALTVTRIGGAALLALGVACALACKETQCRTARGIIIAMLLYNLTAAAIIGFAGIGYGLSGLLLWPGAILHLLTAVWCVAGLGRPPDSRH